MMMLCLQSLIQDAMLRNMPNPTLHAGLPFFPGLPMYAPMHGAVPPILPPMHSTPLLPPRPHMPEPAAPKSPAHDDDSGSSNYVQQLQSTSLSGFNFCVAAFKTYVCIGLLCMRSCCSPSKSRVCM